MRDPVGKRLGDFEIVRELGRGGMGIVFEAVQVSLGRRVALKVIGPGLGLTPRAVDRFHREAEAAARLHHTNIVPIYATGEQDGIHFYAMELIDGPSLDVVIRQMRAGPDDDTRVQTPTDAAITEPYTPTRISAPSGSSGTTLTSSSTDRFERAAAMIAGVAEALHHAHRQGVTHRDIKPSNLLLSSDGRLSVTDFGLARMLEQPGMTITGEFVGTPAYMSPEQVSAGRLPVDHRTDVYSLGATFYELLTLRPPFRADGRDKLLALVVQKEPAPPRSLEPKVPRDLETICLKCLEKDPDRRYPTAGELADDLRRYLNRFAIHARRSGPLTRLKKWARRHPAVAALAACLLVAVLTAGFFAHQAKQDRNQLLAEQRQTAVDRAILEALSGEATTALAAIAEAENKGADPGRLNMLRGLVEIHRGKPVEASIYLVQAERQLPDSVAIKALLAKAHLDRGQFQRFDEMYTALETAQPHTPEDQLFLGLIQAEIDPVVGLQTLDRMPPRARQTSVVRLARATAQTMRALMTGHAEDAEQALEDLRRVDLPDNPLLLSTRLHAYLAAAHASGVTDSQRDAALKQAARDVERLARYRDNPLPALRRCSYYHVLGDDEHLLEAIRQAQKDHADTPFMIDLHVHVLYRRGRFEEAWNVMRVTSSGGYETMRRFQEGIVLLSIPGKKADAEEALNDAIRTGKSGIAPAMMPAYLQLLGPDYRARCEQICLDTREHSPEAVSRMQNGWYHDLLAFHAGVLSEQELLQRAGGHRGHLCEAHFFIGLRRLAEGKRGEAKRCFRRSVDTGVFFFYEYNWSRAFLAHIDDPKWLPWLAEKK